MRTYLNTSSKTASTPLRILTFGAGAIGTYIGGSLALAGHTVTFLERPDVITDLLPRGLTIHYRNGAGKHQAQLPAGSPDIAHLALYPSSEPVPPAPGGARLCATLAEAFSGPPFDIAIFALKSFDTLTALQAIVPFRQVVPPILCLQNGVDNEPALAAALGPDKVIPGSVTSAIGRRAAGDVILERLRGIAVAAGHPLSPRLVSVLSAAGLNARLLPRAADMKWSKLLTNLIANASAAILDMTPAEVFADPALFRLELAQLRECLAVMAARHIQPVDLPGTPVRALAFAVRRLPVGLAHALLARGAGAGRGSKMPSFHIDLHNGRGRSEVDYLNGAVVRAGEKTGIPTPVNQLLTQTLLGLTAGDIPLEHFSHHSERLLDLL